ncbi:hypothetical protein NW768_010411 [Fusarium equiseti]|uniref:DNA repair protein rad5 n=1 Tax=Fusarium equiseti TaxID=61235 RepID=A0ABQ8R1B6_FUSEQ|nr:hypothetical protein NW768_010411 [Fusarium equiseti]
MNTTPHTTDGPEPRLLYAPLEVNGMGTHAHLPIATPGHTIPQAQDKAMENDQHLIHERLSDNGLMTEPNLFLEQTPPVHLTLDSTQKISQLKSENTEHKSSVTPIETQTEQEPSLFVQSPLHQHDFESTPSDDTVRQAEDESENDTDSTVSDKDDSDYVADDNPDSDTEDPPTAPSIPESSKNEATQNIQAALLALENEKRQILLISKWAKPGEDSEKRLKGIENEMIEAKAALDALAAPTSKVVKRRPQIKNVREYFARKHEDEDKRTAKKRRRNPKGGAQKKRKMTNKKVSNGIGGKEAVQPSTSIFSSLNGIESVIAENSAPIMPEFNAATKKVHFEHLKSMIPEGCDNRRVKTQKRDLEEAWKMFGRGFISAVGDRCLMKGMKFGLLDYQLTAVGWIMFRECGRTSPYGGILADAPGLGKTVISLATIIGNPPRGEDDDEFCKATLVVVPNKDIADQWYQEVSKHCEDIWTGFAIKYSRKMNYSLAFIKQQLIVIATYHEVTSELPKKAVVDKFRKEHGDETEQFKEELREVSKGFLNLKWYRVILDEAHQIKNHTTRVKLACCMLRGKYHWALTGTPLSNNLEEIFPYLQFTGCKFTKTFKDFKKKYLGDDMNNANLETLISMIMLRRTNQDTFLGHRVLPLPKAHAHDIKVSLGAKEKAIYEVIFQYFGRVINTLRRRLKNTGDKTLLQKIDKVKLARQVRLRQVTSHPFTIEKIIQERFREDDIVELRRAQNSQSVVPILDNLKEGDKKDDKSHGLAGFATGMNHLETLEDDVFGGHIDMGALLNLAENEAKVRWSTCGLCKKAKPPVKPVQSSNCEHFFCENCLVKALTGGGGTILEHEVKCPSKCITEGEDPGDYTETDCNASLGYGDEMETLVQLQIDAKHDCHFTEPGRDINNARPIRKPEDNGFFIATSHKPTRFPLPPSSKLTVAMAVVTQWLAENPHDKIIIFTQFIITGKLMGRMLEKVGIKFAYYYATGFTDRQRAKSLEAFKTNSECKILIAGLGCGAQSLNLTVTNRVLLIEPWWNKTRELQAFGRVHRMRQEKECFFVRIMTQDHIDSRIDQLQQEKQEIIDRALQDDGHVPTVLSDIQLRQLLHSEDGEELEQEVERALQEAEELDAEGED